MIVHSLTLDHFRNYTHLEAQFHPGVNVIVGENAQGKTNLLEGIAYLASASSHRARFDRDLIQFNQNTGKISAFLHSHSRDITLEAKLHRGGRRQLYSNGVRLKTVGELSGLLRCVLFCPEDLFLVRQGAAVRRRFLDDCICQLRPRYANALTEYRKLLEHKTRILRDWEERPSLLDTLDEFSTQMAYYGALLIYYRARFVERLQEIAPAIHGQCSGGGETLSVAYQTVSTVKNPHESSKVLFEQLLEHQRTHRQAELACGSCLSGPHKDELVLTIDGCPAKEFASQGQTRTAALALKLAARDIFYQETEQWPVLLLDDVLSELDPNRQEFVLNRITAGQVFITCCEVEKQSLLHQGKVFHIQKGELLS